MTVTKVGPRAVAAPTWTRPASSRLRGLLSVCAGGGGTRRLSVAMELLCWDAVRVMLPQDVCQRELAPNRKQRYYIGLILQNHWSINKY